LANPALRFRSVATHALCALALFACGAGDEPGTGTQAVNPFGQTSSGMQQPSSATNPGDTSGTQAPNTPAATGGSPETQPGNIPLTPDTAPPANGGMAQPTPPGDGMPPPGMEPAEPPPPTLERPSRGTPNLFTQDLGIPVGEVDAKLTLAVNRFFGIGTNESETPVVNAGYRVYYELPQDRSMAFIWAADSDDVRSEGMSYGMMIALQMNMQTEFNKLWKFAKTFMQFAPNAAETAWRGYFRWRGRVNRNNGNNWQVTFNEGPAPDGDEYFAAALYLADRRWGSGDGVNYQQEAETISRAMLANTAAGGNTPIINPGSNLVVFFPNNGNQFTDPSYNLPAFYELFALDGPQGDAGRWNTIADASRRLLVISAHPTTGLHPDYANFDGTPNAGSPTFRYDAWRVVMNMAVDFSWFDTRDARMTQQTNKYHAFFGNKLTAAKDNTVNQTYNLDGSNAAGGGSTALTSALGAGAIASTAANRLDFVNAAWNVYQQTGQYRYYQESVYLLGLLATSGLMGYEWNNAQ
jgi:oligosaccharide reducing-end xylanase